MNAISIWRRYLYFRITIWLCESPTRMDSLQETTIPINNGDFGLRTNFLTYNVEILVLFWYHRCVLLRDVEKRPLDELNRTRKSFVLYYLFPPPLPQQSAFGARYRGEWLKLRRRWDMRKYPWRKEGRKDQEVLNTLCFFLLRQLEREKKEKNGAW